MIERERRFQNADGLTIFYREWRPESGPQRGIVLILHGINEHGGRYRHVAEALTDTGLACYAIDHRGHGLSGGSRGHIPDLQLAVADVSQLYELIRARHPLPPPFVFAHSMGSLIGLGFVLRQPEGLRGIALSGTAIHGERMAPAWLVKLLLLTARVLPNARLSPRGPSDVLTRDEGKLREWGEDPLVEKRMWRIGTSAALVRMARQIRASVHAIKTPLLALHGGADSLTPASGARFLAENAASADVTLKIYPGLRHEVVNEIERAEIIADLQDWLLERI
ncbi:MAG: lysophospholipase [Chloroflexi bacterium]|nr:lysophospholipase [Chloroflexota bacterium]